MMAKRPHYATVAVWAGETKHAAYERATQVPVVHSISFGYDDLDTWRAVALGEQPGHIYSRNTNPIVRAFEDKLKALEGAEVGPPLVTSHVECSAAERAAAGIPEGLLRYSTGIEDVEDLIEDLQQALAVLH